MNCIEKMKIKKKRPGMAYFSKKNTRGIAPYVATLNSFLKKCVFIILCIFSFLVSICWRVIEWLGKCVVPSTMNESIKQLPSIPLQVNVANINQFNIKIGSRRKVLINMSVLFHSKTLHFINFRCIKERFI